MEQLPGDATAERCFEESHDTALCLIPPPQLWGPVNALRSLNDEKFTKWPPHITLVYPFVTPEALPDVAEALCRNKIGSLDDDISINLEEAGFFSHRRRGTVFIRPKPGQQVKHLSELRDQIHRFLGRPRGREYRPHLTLAQSEDTQASWHQFLLEKARLLTPLVWHTRQLAVMIRDPVSPNSAGASRPMRLWGYIDLASHSLVRDATTLAAIPSLPVGASLPRPQATFHHNGVNMSWEPLSDSITNADIEPTPLNRLVIASYNVLAEFDWPASSSRYPALVGNILSERASADILVLQEVTDQFLSFLLADSNIRSQYPYTTHGPPDQHGIAPLPSHLNTVVLSKLPFQWEYLRSFKHKGFGILEFPTVQTGGPSESPLKPLVLAACHLSRGLTDAALATKRDEIKKLVEYLNSSFPQHPWVLAGDFNLASSSHTIDQALKKGEISEKGLECLEEIEAIVSKAGLQDTWLVSRVGPGESSSTTGSHESNLGLYEGEQGATFDPISNSLAAASIGAGGSRPQRYDRILVTKSAQLQPYGFNMFGQVMDANEITSQDPASDHWGIRCLLVPSPPNAGVESSSNSKFQGISLRKAALTLGSFDELKDSLVSNGQFPTASDAELRQEAIALLQRTLLENDTTAAEAEKRSHVQLVLIPVGSFGLGVWTSLSDIDCLCVGNISSKTFFSLAVQKLKKASTSGIKILRRVMANTGTMLELEIHGIRFDLQYCAAAAIAQGYPDVLKRPASDPVFSLPVQSIAKLKPARDLVYLRRSIPDMTKYRVAHLFIKAWAQSRGLYSAKFGLLGGIHITSLLVPVCKALANEPEAASTADILTSFFYHYSTFDWETGVVFDPFYHRDLKYHRTFREPLCLLGWHGPSLNTASSASISTVNALASELTRAAALLSQDGMTWSKFLGLELSGTPSSLIEKGAADFLDSYQTYIKISARYWGSSQQKGRKYLGWLESRFISILVDISRKTLGLVPRIWPARFIDEDQTSGTSDENSELSACYLIGLKWVDSIADKSATSQAAAEGNIRVILQEFESRVQKSDKYYDSENCWMSASIMRRSSLGPVRLAPGQLYEYDGTDTDLDDDGESDLEEGNEPESAAYVSKKDSRSLKTGASKSTSESSKPAGAGKLRSAVDAMNRIRWDSGMDSSDYLVGYEDRFLGAQEKALDNWRTEQTDEEFIPQHRILYFRRKSDGAIVWDRRTRVDTIFGSG
ncbi:uncharacterized protein TRIVIDRAFT_59177 [Trichoderma virens Gv29-8]|uniref:polynucleotide adenylyltransferase n=1 Tax=Hypocrea virens (strain Gv29-8 / FGSC 10586) TaxID=413071 RepID=G9MGQ6_HYPVG|nr:uncharacterized protein TRIVIDRAFT_59177 [Trichoderma virens Gv29-8]EHK26701.1 hypothetical protein TRIVIDRAFT_59177 [Trichoderma virens Gv29-8]UKZ46877.1 hypothetical protein TrVGV298_001088 [Trichoderma virens]